MSNESNSLVTILEGLNSISEKYRTQEHSGIGCVGVAEIVIALNQFMECVRYLNTRRTDGAILRLESEADVQDALFLMLRPWIVDLVPEDPNGRIGNRFTIKDFYSASARVVIEAKFIRDAQHGKHISKEMHDDIETYRHHRGCDDLIFFIFDPNTFIPDGESLRRGIQAQRVYDGRELRVHLVVKP